MLHPPPCGLGDFAGRLGEQVLFPVLCGTRRPSPSPFRWSFPWHGPSPGLTEHPHTHARIAGYSRAPAGLPGSLSGLLSLLELCPESHGSVVSVDSQGALRAWAAPLLVALKVASWTVPELPPSFLVTGIDHTIALHSLRPSSGVTSLMQSVGSSCSWCLPPECWVVTGCLVV